jgi:hypothetical protein
MIVIVCEYGVIFYDFVTQASRLVQVNDLSTKPKSITSATFVFYDLIAIGCIDGLVRIWDCNKWMEVKVNLGIIDRVIILNVSTDVKSIFLCRC